MTSHAIIISTSTKRHLDSVLAEHAHRFGGISEGYSPPAGYTSRDYDAAIDWALTVVDRVQGSGGFEMVDEARATLDGLLPGSEMPEWR